MGLLHGEKLYQDPSNSQPLVHPNKANSCRWSSQYSLQTSCKKKNVNCQHVCLLQRVSPHAATAKNKTILVGMPTKICDVIISSWRSLSILGEATTTTTTPAAAAAAAATPTIYIYLLPIFGRKTKSLSFGWAYPPFTNLQPLPGKPPTLRIGLGFLSSEIWKMPGIFLISRASTVWAPATNNTHRYNKKRLQRVKNPVKKNKKNKWCLLKTTLQGINISHQTGSSEHHRLKSAIFWGIWTRSLEGKGTS